MVFNRQDCREADRLRKIGSQFLRILLFLLLRQLGVSDRDARKIKLYCNQKFKGMTI